MITINSSDVLQKFDIKLKDGASMSVEIRPQEYADIGLTLKWLSDEGLLEGEKSQRYGVLYQLMLRIMKWGNIEDEEHKPLPCNMPMKLRTFGRYPDGIFELFALVVEREKELVKNSQTSQSG